MEAILTGGLTNALVATLLAAACLGVTCLWRNPYVARALWLAVLLKLITPPVLEIPTAWLDAHTIADRMPPAAGHRATAPVQLMEGPPLADVVSPGVAPAALSDGRERGVDGGVVHRSRKPVEIRSQRAPICTADVAATFWLMGTICMIAVVALRIARFHHMIARTKPAPNSLRKQAADLAARLGLAKVPRLCIVDSRLPPLVWSAGRGTTILLPGRLFNRLSPDKAAAVLAHELMHVRRRDHWIRWIESAVLCAFWWHPIAWLARHKLQAAEERCCDADVLRALPQFRRPYAEALLQTLEFLTNPHPAACLATGFTQRSSVVRRFEMIVQSHPAARPLLSVRGALLGVVLLVLVASPVASPANPETNQTGKGSEGIPCTVTLKDGTTMEGYIVRLADDRVVIRRRQESTDETVEQAAEPVEPPQRVDEPQQDACELDLSECVRICLMNSAVLRQMNVPLVNDGVEGTLMFIAGEGNESRPLDVRSATESLVRDVETAYWELWWSYHEFQTLKAGRDAVLEIWRDVHRDHKAGMKHASAAQEAQSRTQYMSLRRAAEEAASHHHRAEQRLRHLIGLSRTDGRQIRPSEVAQTTKTSLDWAKAHEEALSQRTEILKARQHIEAIEQEIAQLVADKSPDAPQFKRNETKVLRETLVLRDIELEVSHQLADAIRDVDRRLQVVQSRYDVMDAEQQECERVRHEYGRGRLSLDRYLDNFRRRIDAERNYSRSLADYALAVARLHERKGSLLEHHGVSIAEP